MPRSWLIEFRALLLVAAPLVLAQLAQNGMSFVDTVMIGRLGPSSLAGMALGATVFSLVLISCMALVMSVSPLAAQAVGAGRPEEAAKIARHGLVMALLIAVPVALFVANAAPLLRYAGQEASIVASAETYLRAVAFAFPGAFSVVALRGFLEGHGDTRPIMFIAVGGVLLNAATNELLIFGRLGLPALGLPGAGYATSFTYAVMALALGVVIARRYAALRVFSGWKTPDLSLYRELLAVGWPISLTLGFEVGLFSAAALVMGRFGEAPLAGHQIAIQMSSLTFMVPLGIGIAAGIRVGQAAGRKDARGVRLAGWMGMALAAMFMVFAAATYLLAPRAIVALFLDLRDPVNAAVIGYATSFLVLAGLFQVFDGVQVAAAGALRGLKDTRMPMFITLLAYWLIGLPVGMLGAFTFGLGPRGMWFGLIIALVVAALLLSTRFRLLTRELR
ncbi:MAG TPA: MATE family efflux transporter [Trueperaceae bacterium]|nr:MATE family efflux transporter [Trueperaceae bacterium]